MTFPLARLVSMPSGAGRRELLRHLERLRSHPSRRLGFTAAEKDIRGFASERLDAFKVLAKIIILNEIPKGATSKLQRIGLAEKLGLV